MIDYYLKKGHSLEWIEARIKAIINRKKLTSTWKENGIEKEYEYGLSTNEIYKTWSGMSVRDYKEYKGIRKENLRDNMTDIEVILTDLGEISTRMLAKKHKPYELNEKRRLIKEDDIIEFTCRTTMEKLRTKVVKLHLYKSFEQLYTCFDNVSLGYAENDIKDPKDMKKYYTEEDECKYGVVGIEIKLI